MKEFIKKILSFFKSPTKEDGFLAAKTWIEKGIYTAEELSILADRTFDKSEFDDGINEYLRSAR